MIQMKDIVREGHPALRKVAQEATIPPTKEDIQILNKMMEFLTNSQDQTIAEKYKLRPGVGLAAPQININKRLIAVHFLDPQERLYSYKLLNPTIISHSVEKAYLTAGEGCLSVDRNVEGYVPRYARITVKAFNTDGEQLKLRLRDYAAIVFQHEIDHLNGIMFYDHINKENPFRIPENAKAIE